MTALETTCKVHCKLESVLDNGGIGDKLFGLVLEDATDKIAKALMGALILEGVNPDDYRDTGVIIVLNITDKKKEGGEE